MTPEAIDKVRALERFTGTLAQVEIPTEHLLHAGLYARTIRIPAGVLLTGAHIKRATVLVISGHVTVFVGEGSIEITGYQVLPASAGRKQVFLAHTDTFVTMLFPTEAATVEAAENEFTDEAGRLLSRRQACESTTITGEVKCLEP
jgi:hypothetical protein